MTFGLEASLAFFFFKSSYGLQNTGTFIEFSKEPEEKHNETIKNMIKFSENHSCYNTTQLIMKLISKHQDIMSDIALIHKLLSTALLAYL